MCFFDLSECFIHNNEKFSLNTQENMLIPNALQFGTTFRTSILS